MEITSQTALDPSKTPKFSKANPKAYLTKLAFIMVKVLKLFQQEERIEEEYMARMQQPTNLQLDPLEDEELQAVLDTFRFVLKSEEFSSRSLLLSEAVIRSIPSHYSAFDYRKDFLKRVKARDLDFEGNSH